MLDAGSRRNVWKRIEGEERPAWSDVTSTGTFHINPGQTFDRHYHDCDEYWFIFEGSAVIEIDEERYTIEAGDIVCTEIGREHDFLQVFEPVTGFWFEAVLKLDGVLGKGREGHLHRSPERAGGHRVLGPDEQLGP